LVWVKIKDCGQFNLRWELVSWHHESPCDMGTSVIDQTEIVKEWVWH
jgi:hypothetical protein